MIIIENGFGSSDISDVLNSTRLQTIPSNGVLTIEAIASVVSASNLVRITIQWPNGENPCSANVVFAGLNGDLAMDTRTKFMISHPITPDKSGGHVVLAFDVEGTNSFIWRATFVGESA